MEKVKNAIILAVEIVIVVAIIIFITIYIGASGTESSYQKVLGLINSKNFKEAASVAQQIPHYKDSSELYVYIYPNSLYYKNYKTTEERLSGYNDALNYIHLMKSKLKTKKYKDSFNELEKAIGFKIDEINAQKQYDGMNTVINDSANLITKGDYLGAQAKLNAMNNPNYDSVKTELLAYINFLNAVNLNNKTDIRSSIAGLDPNYNGILSSDISNAVLAYVDAMKWGRLYKGNGTSNNQITMVTIGMKKNDVITALGNPILDNVILSKYGDFEIMNYPDNKTLYFENSTLTTFKQ